MNSTLRLAASKLLTQTSVADPFAPNDLGSIVVGRARLQPCRNFFRMRRL
jgi:hypothetical protein